MSAQNSKKQRGKPFPPGKSGNPKGRPRSKSGARTDAWTSVTTGLGTSRDRRTTITHSSAWLAYEELRDIYRGDGMAARIVDLLPSEELRKGLDVAIRSDDGGERDKDASEAVVDRLDELNAVAKLKQARQWARAFGGAGILLGVNDGSTDLSTPLNLARVHSLDWLTVLASQELQPSAWYDDARHPRYGQPAIYRITPQTQTSAETAMQQVHESRILRFDGVTVTREQLRENAGWGDSVLVRLHEALRDFGAAWGGVSHLLTEYGQGVLTIPGLLEMSASGEGGNALAARLATFEAYRSTVRTAVLDGGNGEGMPAETFQRQQTPISGVADLLDRFSQRFAAIIGAPISLLMGQSPAGLNATGDADARWWYDSVAASQSTELRPQINRLLKVLFLSRTGPTQGVEPKSWRAVFPPLREMSDKEKADIRLVTSQADALDIANGVLDASEVAISRYGGDEYSTETTLDIETRTTMTQAPATEEVVPE